MAAIQKGDAAKAIDSMGLAGDLLGIKFLYNPEVASSTENAINAANNASDVSKQIPKEYQALADQLNGLAKNYPSYRKTMIAQGYMNPDGTINFKKMLDTGYLKELQKNMKENAGLLSAQSARNALVSNARGNVSSTANKFAQSKVFADSLRKNLQQYSQNYKGERERAYNKAKGLGSEMAGAKQRDYTTRGNYLTSAQRSKIAKAKQQYQNALSDYNMAAQYAKDQSKGLLQDPQKAVQLAATVAKFL